MCEWFKNVGTSGPTFIVFILMQDGPPKIAFSCLKSVAEFYGLYFMNVDGVL